MIWWDFLSDSAGDSNFLPVCCLKYFLLNICLTQNISLNMQTCFDRRQIPPCCFQIHFQFASKHGKACKGAAVTWIDNEAWCAQTLADRCWRAKWLDDTCGIQTIRAQQERKITATAAGALKGFSTWINWGSFHHYFNLDPFCQGGEIRLRPQLCQTPAAAVTLTKRHHIKFIWANSS